MGGYRTYLNLFATFLIGGIWHGAGWTFVFWGVLHGGALVIHRLWSVVGFTMPRVLAWFVTFNFVNIAWVFFRANEWSDAINIIKSMFFLSDIARAEVFVLSKNLDVLMINLEQSTKIFSHNAFGIVAWILAAFIIVLRTPNSMALLKEFRPTKESLFFQIALIAISLFYIDRVSEFIYFNF